MKTKSALKWLVLSVQAVFKWNFPSVSDISRAWCHVLLPACPRRGHSWQVTPPRPWAHRPTAHIQVLLMAGVSCTHPTVSCSAQVGEGCGARGQRGACRSRHWGRLGCGGDRQCSRECFWYPGLGCLWGCGWSPETLLVTAKPEKMLANLPPPSLCLLCALQIFYKLLQMFPTTLVKFYLPEQNCNYFERGHAPRRVQEKIPLIINACQWSESSAGQQMTGFSSQAHQNHNSSSHLFLWRKVYTMHTCFLEHYDSLISIVGLWQQLHLLEEHAVELLHWSGWRPPWAWEVLQHGSFSPRKQVYAMGKWNRTGCISLLESADDVLL